MRKILFIFCVLLVVCVRVCSEPFSYAFDTLARARTNDTCKYVIKGCVWNGTTEISMATVVMVNDAQRIVAYTQTDVRGHFELVTDTLPVELIVCSIGHRKQSVEVTKQNYHEVCVKLMECKMDIEFDKKPKAYYLFKLITEDNQPIRAIYYSVDGKNNQKLDVSGMFLSPHFKKSITFYVDGYKPKTVRKRIWDKYRTRPIYIKLKSVKTKNTNIYLD